jgi:hypothetical protein
MTKQNKEKMAPSIMKGARLFLEKEKGLGIIRPTKGFKIVGGI